MLGITVVNEFCTGEGRGGCLALSPSLRNGRASSRCRRGCFMLVTSFCSSRACSPFARFMRGGRGMSACGGLVLPFLWTPLFLLFIVVLLLLLLLLLSVLCIITSSLLPLHPCIRPLLPHLLRNGPINFPLLQISLECFYLSTFKPYPPTSLG